MSLWVVLVVFVLLALAVPRYGVDSRWSGPGYPHRPMRPDHTVRGDLVALARVVRQVVGSRGPRTKISTVRPPLSRRSAL